MIKLTIEIEDNGMPDASVHIKATVEHQNATMKEAIAAREIDRILLDEIGSDITPLQNQ